MSDVRKNNQSADDAVIAYIIVIGVIIVGGGIAAYKYQAAIIGGWKVFILPFTKAIAWFASSWAGAFFNDILHTTSIQATGLVHFLTTTPASEMSWGFFMAANAFVGKYLLIIFVPIALFQTIKHIRGSSGLAKTCRRFKNSKEFRDYASSTIYRAVLRNVSVAPIDDFDYGAAKSCIEFCEDSGIIEKELEKYDLSAINAKKAREIYVSQLGKQYSSQEELFESGVGWMIKLLLANIPEEERAQKLEFALKTHRYVSTICINLLHSARRFGVVPISLFIKLREEDRALWYAVTSLGRRTIFAEGAGIITQFQHEITLAIKSPEVRPQLAQVDAAVTGLIASLKEEFEAKVPSCSLAEWDMIVPRSTQE